MRKVGNLQISTPGDREIVMTRVFDAPRRLVFDALTRPELLRRWFDGPPGWTLTVCEIDLRVGGSYRYEWSGTDGASMGLGGVYREVLRPQRLVATEVFDESWYPGEALDTTELAEHDGKTTLTITVVYESAAAREAVLKSPMEQGVALGYDKMAEVLATLLAQGAWESP